MNTDYNIEISKERTPMESLILLLVILGLSDRQLVFEEQTKIQAIITNHFPEHSEQRYQELLQSTISTIKNLDFNSQTELLKTVSVEIKTYYSGKETLPIIFSELKELLEADGIVYSFEAQLLEMINKIWN
ncbi:MAG TPA: hypothetical protein QGH56_08615 [Candidatus Marinimicrobia bacterium]|jgi:hypothetical protein|nr:hypothetical protein [Candidatus Neomarinimicrobiota bacterium]